MSLLRKGASFAMVSANRGNAQKSTGPTSARGKSVSRYNAKKWGRAELLRPLMPALGEDPKEFEAVLDNLRRVLAPSDAFEEMLVTDMAEIQWRLRRMILAETAARAKSRRHQQADDEAADARLESGQLHMLEPEVVRGGFGLVGLNDSPVKFRQIIEFLQQIDEEVQQKGFQREGPSLLRCFYGKNPSFRGLTLIAAYEICLKDEQAATVDEGQMDDSLPAPTDSEETGSGGATGAGTAQSTTMSAAGSKHSINYRAEFHKVIANEIDWFAKRAARDRQARAELKVPRIEAALELDEKSRASLVNQERLERIFERKWKLLVRYRREQLTPCG